MFVDWFYADPHFGHARILEYADRPFASVEEHDAELERRYRATVLEGDVVAWVGDAFLCPFARAREILSRLPGWKVLVLGNHDRSATSMVALGFDLVVESMVVSIPTFGADSVDRPALVHHYPYLRSEAERGAVSPAERHASRRPERKPGQVLVHGHVHSRSRACVAERTVHVGVDAWDYAPASIAEVGKIVSEMR